MIQVHPTDLGVGLGIAADGEWSSETSHMNLGLLRPLLPTYLFVHCVDQQSLKRSCCMLSWYVQPEILWRRTR
jgi:hypothetical protein